MAAPRVDVYNDSLPGPAKVQKRVQYLIQQTALKTLALPAPTSMRPLNSWMAFRSYYKAIFRDSQQKEISTFLTTLWTEDPFKAKWSMLAKVYSIIRDVRGKPLAPLGPFLDLCCPLIGIIHSTEYLYKLHWHMVTENGKKGLIQVLAPNLSEIEDCYKHTNLSESDIIAYCINHGYMPAAQDVFKNMDDKGQRLMVSLPHFNPTPEKVGFMQQAARDPMALAAQIFDIPVDHAYLYAAAPDMEWTGRMTDIYNPADNPVIFGGGMDHEYFNPIDLSNPAQTASYLTSLGNTLPMVQSEVADASERYAVEDSF